MQRIELKDKANIVTDIDMHSFVNKLMPLSYFSLTDKEKVLYDAEIQERQNEKRRLSLENYFNSSSNVPDRFKQARLSTFQKEGLPMAVSSKLLPKGNMMDKENLEVIFQFCNDIKNHKGANLWFCGGKGTGKTSLACSILYELCMSGIPVQYFRMTTLMQQLENASHTRNSVQTVNSVYSEVCETSVCVIDEIGRWYNQQAEQYRLFELVDRLYNVRNGVIFITNLPRQDFADYLGDAITDRFSGHTTCFEFTGKSFRGCNGELYS